MATYAIKQLIDKIGLGEIRIPAFQRGFVWTPEKVSFLMDSIYRGYPIGSLLLWKTQDRLNSEKDVGPYKLPEPREKYPISYVLDGQQRLTSFFATFQTDLQPDPDAEIDWLDVYFDLMAQEDSESLFVSLPEEEVDPARYFPLASIYDVGGYRSATRGLNDQMQEKCEALRLRFIQAQILAEEIDNPDREQVAIIFERVNRAGVPLDTFQLLAAWTWSTEFDLREQFQDLSDEVEDFGFGDIRDEPNLLLKCCSAVVAGEATPKAIIRLRGPDVRRDFPAIKSGVLGTIDFLRRELNILSLRMMPYPAMMVPLAKFFATDRSSGRSLTHRQRRR
ncbi:MAG: DUF262 domain-containing protein [Armatimonadetes bacterium]|nr:DUF262 domain-containing protein [Armatimonadota bacterium]